jgi:hypothetical protein
MFTPRAIAILQDTAPQHSSHPDRTVEPSSGDGLFLTPGVQVFARMGLGPQIEFKTGAIAQIDAVPERRALACTGSMKRIEYTLPVIDEAREFGSRGERAAR